MRGAKGWCDGAEVSGSFSSNVGSQHWCEVKRTELSDGFISLKRKHLHIDSKEMPLRYLSLTLVVTERKAHCFLILSYLVCHWISQPDYFFGQQWEYYYCLTFAQLWHFVPTYRTHNKYSPCSWGMECKKICSFPLPSFRCLDLGCLTSQSPGGKWVNRKSLGRMPWLFGFAGSPRLYPCVQTESCFQIRLWSCRCRPSLFFFFLIKKKIVV